MHSSDRSPASDPSFQKFIEFLGELAARGINQQELAKRLGIASQYVSDVKARRRAISELFIRRLADEFDRPRDWFMNGRGTKEIVRKRLAGRPAVERSARTYLPVLPNPIRGDPFNHPKWDGGETEVGGVAAVRALAARWPYLLRLGICDRQGRLQKDDLLLISQQSEPSAKIVVLELADKAFLARRKKPRGWVALDQVRVVTGDPEVIGHCLGIMWATL